MQHDSVVLVCSLLLVVVCFCCSLLYLVVDAFYWYINPNTHYFVFYILFYLTLTLSCSSFEFGK
jgi:hypothetical protein